MIFLYESFSRITLSKLKLYIKNNVPFLIDKILSFSSWLLQLIASLEMVKYENVAEKGKILFEWRKELFTKINQKLEWIFFSYRLK
jgi:hypothetical protein